MATMDGRTHLQHGQKEAQELSEYPVLDEHHHQRNGQHEGALDEMAQRQVDDERMRDILVETMVHEIHNDGDVHQHTQQSQSRVLDEK